jgi:rsbT co-antagonist protein RsbR
MATVPNQRSANLSSIITEHKTEILSQWLREMSGATRRADLMKDAEIQSQASGFLDLLAEAAELGSNIHSQKYEPIRQMLGEISSSRARQGFTPSETATFIFSIKRPLFSAIQEEHAKDAAAIAREMWSATELLDSLGLYTTEVFSKSREEVIRRQQEEMLELSTPVVKLWDGILALPLIGTLDSARTQIVMESLLESIVQTNSRVAIIDITGVPTVDTIVAQHLLKAVTAARLMGADCIISGVRPQIAQTIVHLGINLLDVTTKATLSDAFALAIKRSGLVVSRPEKERKRNVEKENEQN